ncbi:putative tRNA N6-adenosine threonylcarbamoyltransferase [Nymphaea thermarum]|nr:putative tRNA N6-adenosine threonylcarbamoyltransferase [Nymphaea thermarum]
MASLCRAFRLPLPLCKTVMHRSFPLHRAVFKAAGSAPHRFRLFHSLDHGFDASQHHEHEILAILGIETSCDDTAAAVVKFISLVTGDGKILSQVVSSQADLLARYGGVAPKMAEEAHKQVIDEVIRQALGGANLTERDLSAVAVTIGPGLSLCLRVGVQKARQIAGKFSLPIVGVHHMEAHALIARVYVYVVLELDSTGKLIKLVKVVLASTHLQLKLNSSLGQKYEGHIRGKGLYVHVEGIILEPEPEFAKIGNGKMMILEGAERWKALDD